MAGALALLGAGASLYSGIASYQISKGQSSMLEEQGALAKEDYDRQAKAVRDDAYRLRQKQTMDYISMGVEIQGTPLLLMKETEIQSEYDASYLEEVGARVESLYKKRAKIARQEGVAALVSGIMGGGGALMKG